MSSPATGAAQRRRLVELGLGVATLPPLRDVDTIDDATAVAAAAPGTRFASRLRALGYETRPMSTTPWPYPPPEAGSRAQTASASSGPASPPAIARRRAASP